MRTVTLTADFTELDGLLRPRTSLLVEVEYSPEENEVHQINTVIAYDHETKASIDVTSIFNDHFDRALNDVVDTYEWRELHLASLHNV